MTDSPRRDGAEPTQPLGGSYPGPVDPAYASQAYGPSYPVPVERHPMPNPTEQLPAYSPYGYDAYATGQYGPPYPPGEPPEQPQPEGPRSPRWLWLLAAVAVVVVLGLVIALVVVNSSRQQTVTAPLPPMPQPSPTTRAPTTNPMLPLPTPAPVVPTTTPPTEAPTESLAPGTTETVTYEVTGDGRAINITYVDTGRLLQTEFNVMLPWSKQVELPAPADDSASVTVINVGRDVTCTVSVNGVVVEQRTGSGLTLCVAAR